MIADDVARAHGVEDLFSDALLSGLVEIKEVSRPKILPLGVCLMAFLTIGLHAVDVLLRVFTHARVICIHAYHHVLAIAKLQPRMRPAAAKAAVDPLAFPPSRGGRFFRGVTSTAGVAGECSLGLTRERACRGLVADTSGGCSWKCLG
jgi:hypothetical protein